MAEMAALEPAYLRSSDPIVQSGFSSGRERWVAERSPLVDGIASDGEFLDVGCANGLLAQDVVAWAAGAGFRMTPFGVDLGPGLVALARQRLPVVADNFVAADAWTWEPGRRWDYVYSILNCAPKTLWCDWLSRLAGWVEPGGRLIVGFYGSRSRGIVPEDVGAVMGRCGFRVAGESFGNTITRFAWADVL